MTSNTSEYPYSSPGIYVGTLTMIRWLAVSGQSCAILVTHFIAGIEIQIFPALGIILSSVLVNIFAHFFGKRRRLPSQGKVFTYLLYDLVQVSLLTGLCGGLTNPFSIFIIAPTTVGAAILDRNNMSAILLATLISATLLRVFYIPMGWSLEFPGLILNATWGAICLSAVFITYYIYLAAKEAKKLSSALHATQMAISRQEQINKLGALATAAVHELGSPLNTIRLATEDMKDGFEEESEAHDDFKIIIEQLERCREILANLSRKHGKGSTDYYALVPPDLLLNTALEQCAAENTKNIHVKIFHRASENGEYEDTLKIKKTPEIMYGLINIIKNALDFAEKHVSLIYEYNEDIFYIEIRDDGDGFSSNILSSAGLPYISSRSENGKNMGLGIFIARTLLERSGATITFSNVKNFDSEKDRSSGITGEINTNGAMVQIVWPRDVIDCNDKNTHTEGASMP